MSRGDTFQQKYTGFEIGTGRLDPSFFFVPSVEHPIPDTWRPPTISAIEAGIHTEEGYLAYLKKYDPNKYLTFTYKDETGIRRLREQCHPQIRREYQEDLSALIHAARQDGHNIVLDNAYRSSDQQAEMLVLAAARRVDVISRMQPERAIVDIQNQVERELGSRVLAPGLSTHALGRAMDLNPFEMLDAIEQAAINRTELELPAIAFWLEENAWKFGFIQAYPQNRESTTGVIYEPWHYEYIGRELAAQFTREQEQDPTLVLKVWLARKFPDIELPNY